MKLHISIGRIWVTTFVTMRTVCFLFFLITAIADIAKAANPECLEDRPNDTCVVKASSHSFSPPNLLIPEDVRGVYWIDAGPDAPGYSNPWVDLNYLTPFPDDDKKAGQFYVLDKTAGYQSWEDVDESFPYIKSLQSRTTRSEVDPTDLTVNWSACLFTCGTSFETWFPLPISSPSKKVGENEYIRQAKIFGYVVAEWKGYRIIDDKGKKTGFFDQMIQRIDDRAVLIPE